MARLLEALGLHAPVARGASESASGDGDADRRGAALAVWQTERAGVLAALKLLEISIRRMSDPEGDAAIILVKAIAANLTQAPTTARAVAELERYLDTDDIIAEAEEPNGFGVDIRIRGPLLPALAALKSSLAAT